MTCKEFAKLSREQKKAYWEAQKKRLTARTVKR